tara:strand:- start:505 stop:882 length:378 start_codon:yes stop_codon:yes gene_type:complete
MNWSAILFVIAMVESGGNPNVKDGDNGQSWGMYQIQSGYIEDVNRVYKTNYTHEDARDRNKAELIVVKYLRYWGNRYELNTGNAPTAEDYFRLHNGGCHFYKKKHKTDNYVKKCLKIIDKYNLKI